MKFTIKNTTGENIINLMRMAQYHYMGIDKDKNQLSFVRSVGGSPYPRFHIYLRENKDTKELFFNLHLDQKKPIYKGAPAHSADYESEVVGMEAKRIKQLLEVQLPGGS